MKVSAVTLARLVAFIEPVDINPRGQVHYPALAAALVARYGFLKSPQKAEDFDESKGILFEGGKFGNVGNVRVQIFSYGISVDTASSTEDSERMLEDALVWASKEHGLTYQQGMIKRKAFVSQLTFFSDVGLTRLHPAVTNLAEKLSGRVPQFLGQGMQFTPSALFVSIDPFLIKSPPAPFSIERRAETPFSENKFFSTAPLPTEEHIRFLEAFEADIVNSA